MNFKCFKVIVCISLMAVPAFAGSTKILCKGTQIEADIVGKGPNPYGSNIEVKLTDSIVKLQKIHYFEDNDSYDFQALYQSMENGTGYVAVLEFVAGKHSLTFFTNARLVEAVPCVVGF